MQQQATLTIVSNHRDNIAACPIHMIARKFLLFLGLCLALVASASEPSQPATQTDIQQVQQQILVLDKELTVLKEVTTNRLDSQDKRVGDLGLWTSQQANHMSSIANVSTLLGLLIAIISILAGLAVFFTTKQRAIEESRKHAEIEARKWFSKNNTELENQINNLKKLASEHENYAHLFKNLIKNAGQKILDTPDLTKTDPSTLEALDAISSASQALNSKPENEFTADDHYVRGLDEFSAKRFDSALISFRKSVDLLESESASPQKQANAMFALAVTLEQLSSNDEAITIYDKLDQRFSEDDTPATRELIAKALFNKGGTLHKLGRGDESLTAFEQLDQRFQSDTSPDIRRIVSMALVNKGAALHQLQRGTEAITTYQQVDQRFANDTTPGIREQVAMALFSIGVLLYQMGRSDESIATYDQVDQRFCNDLTPKIREQVAKSIFNKGVVLQKLERINEAIATFDQLERRFGDDPTSEMRKQVAMAITNKGAILHKLDRIDEAKMALEQVIQRYASDSNPELKQVVERTQQLLNELRGDSEPKAEPA